MYYIYKCQGRRDRLKVEGLKVLYIQMSGEEGQALGRGTQGTIYTNVRGGGTGFR